MTTKYYAVRIHADELGDDCHGRVRRFFQGVDGSYVMACETEATRTHFQGWIKTITALGTLRARLKAAFPECVGNKGYSLGKCREFEAYQRYVCKGTITQPPRITCKCGMGITDEYISGMYAEYWRQNEKIVRNTSTLAAATADYARRLMEQGCVVSRRDLARFCCDAVIERNKPEINVFRIRNIVNRVMYEVDHDAREIILDEIVNRY